MKCLFVVRGSDGKVLKCEAGTRWFADKFTAKDARDEAGGVSKGFFVSRGPEHMGKHGDSPNGVPMMRRQPKARGC
jgi:hypothetical protein